jgi:hypothetical protein
MSRAPAEPTGRLGFPEQRLAQARWSCRAAQRRRDGVDPEPISRNEQTFCVWPHSPQTAFPAYPSYDNIPLPRVVRRRPHTREPRRSHAWPQDMCREWLKALQPNETNGTALSGRDGVCRRFWTTVQIALWYLVDSGEPDSGFVDVRADVAHRLHSQAQQQLPQQPQQQEGRAPRNQLVDHLTGRRRKIRYDQQPQEPEHNLVGGKEAGHQAGLEEDTVVEEKAERRQDTEEEPAD